MLWVLQVPKKAIYVRCFVYVNIHNIISPNKNHAYVFLKVMTHEFLRSNNVFWKKDLWVRTFKILILTLVFNHYYLLSCFLWVIEKFLLISSKKIPNINVYVKWYSYDFLWLSITVLSWHFIYPPPLRNKKVRYPIMIRTVK